MDTINYALPGNPRYQPGSLKDIFGYDVLYRAVGRVEIACLEVLGEIGVIPSKVFRLLTDEVKAKILAIKTTEIDVTERTVTKHDIRAWVYEACATAPEELGPWFHVILTSYDVLDTARILQFVEAHNKVIKPLYRGILDIFIDLVRSGSDILQIGRTHGQHALPITIGFWLANILNALFENYIFMNECADKLVGKISGAVGAYNAQQGLGITGKCKLTPGGSFEERILKKLDITAARISSQIISPFNLSRYLFACELSSAIFAQFGRDCRQLMRSEIAEISEDFVKGQSGSSTMAQKRNPINFENLEGTWLKNKNEFGKVLDTLISEHQRDLVNSSVVRDFPIIIVNLVTQMEKLLQRKDGDTFLERITVNKEACQRNFELTKNVILAEPLYIALQMAGFSNAHELVNHTFVPQAQKENKSLYDIAEAYVETDLVFKHCWNNLISKDVKKLLNHPELYTGLAEEKALEIAIVVENYLK